MLKEAIKYIVGLSAPIVQEINGETYSDKELHRIHHDPTASPIRMNTLSSLVDYINGCAEDYIGQKMIVHIQSPTRVCLYSALNAERERECLAEVTAQTPDFRFDNFTEHETFCISVQSKFADSKDRALLLRFAGTVEAGTVAEYGDDGISQKATIKTGIASKGDALVPNRVCLAPFRTFTEVAQPCSEFVFRMKQNGSNDIYCALFEADGGAWKNDAMTEIHRYLSEALADKPDFTVIS